MKSKRSLRGSVAETTSRGRIYDIVKKKINDGVFLPGQALRIADLASEMKVSQTPVREALTRLEGEGLVDSLPYRGVVVKGLSKDELVEIYALRELLECAALKVAVPKLTAGVLEQAQAILDRSIGVNDSDMLNELNWNFHTLIFSQSEMPILCDMIQSLRGRVSRYLRMYYAMAPGRFIQDHQEQLNNYRNRDVEGAVALRKINLDRSFAALLRLVSV